MNLVVSFLAVAVAVVDCLTATTGLESTGGAGGLQFAQVLGAMVRVLK